MGLEGVVESPQAGKTAGEGHVDDRQRGVGEQQFGGEQALGFQQLVRRYTELVLDHAPQMALADAHFRRQHAHAALVERAVLDTPGQRHRETVAGIDQRVTGRELGTAAQAGTEASLLGRGGVRIEAAVTAQRPPRITDEAAVDSGGGDADEHEPVEAGIPAHQRLVTAFLIELHAPMLPALSPTRNAFNAKRRADTLPTESADCG